MPTKLHLNFAEAQNSLPKNTLTPANTINPISEWQPDPLEETYPFVPDDIPYEEGWVDLSELPKGEGVNVQISGGDYTIRKLDDERIKLWCGRADSYPHPWLSFIGKVTSLGVSIARSTEYPSIEIDYYPGIIASRSPEAPTNLQVPEFSYDRSGRLLTPNPEYGSWVGEVLGVRVFDL